MYKRSYVVLLILALAAMVFSACAAPAAPAPGADTGAEGEAMAMGPVVLRTNALRGEPPTADPQLASDTSSNRVVRSIFLGLTKENPDDSSAEPSLATDWSVSEDGLTWTFNIRTDVPWVKYNADSGEVEQVTDDAGNVRTVTASDFEYGIKRACDAATASDYAYILYIIEGCEAANSGEGSVDDIAAIAIDDSTLQITTTVGAGFFPQLLMMTTSYATPQWVIEEFGDSWIEAENIVSNGPFAMSEWIHQDSMQLVKNPYWFGWEEDPRAGNVDVIDMTMIQEESTAFAMYENGELEHADVPLDLMSTVFGEGSDYADQGYIYPQNSTYYYGFVMDREAVSDSRVRRALSMAVDRETLVENILQGGQVPANTLTNPANFGSPALDPEVASWALSEENGGTGYAAAVEMAQELMAEAGYPDGAGLSLSLGHNVSEAHAKIAQAIQAMWTAAFPQIQVDISSQEWGVYLETIENASPREGKPDVFRLGWNADYPHSNNWVHEVMNPEAGANRVMMSPDDPEVGDAVAEFTQLTYDAQAAPLEEQPELYKRAEQLLIEEIAAIIPIYYYTGVQVTKPYVDRVFHANSYYEFWTVDVAGQ